MSQGADKALEQETSKMESFRFQAENCTIVISEDGTYKIVSETEMKKFEEIKVGKSLITDICNFVLATVKLANEHLSEEAELKENLDGKEKEVEELKAKMAEMSLNLKAAEKPVPVEQPRRLIITDRKAKQYFTAGLVKGQKMRGLA